ncbi:ATP-binding protein [Vibrio parahaemolyticus]|nr:ATP-binding protein [Vibrio parahaemolyticus]
MGTYCSPRELSLIAGLPQKEVAGIALNEEVNFGLNPPQVDEGSKLVLGELVQDGRSIPNNDVSLNISELNKHMFVAGVTGSGKTTTCHHLLREAKLPFLVIEPAKTEYRTLLEEFDDLLIFTPGRDDLGAFRLNPLELMPGESISARVDILKASFAASFDMEAAIPQVLEAAIYRCYEKMGWNLTTSRHPEFPNPFAENVYPFPIMQDLLEVSKEVIDEQGFDTRLRDDYIGSIKARLQGLLVGSKKQIFNTLRSIDFAALLKRRVVIELEEIRNGAEKSLIMAFIMTNMVQALKNEHRVNPGFRHLTLIEEAHRLLAHPDPSESNNKKQAVEMFADMLAEIRKYGEGLVIVDQIPSKLTPEVLKSTNTKIVHKLFAQDDKDAIGNTIALEKDQKTYLSRLDVGHCVVFSQGWQKAVQVQVKVDPTLVTQADLPLNEVEKVIRGRFIEFCKLPTNRRLLPMLSHSGLSSISTKQVSDLLKFSQETDLFFCWEQFLVEQSDTSKEKVVQSIKKGF